MNVPSGSPQPEGPKAPSRLSRRGFVLGGLVLAAGAAVFAGRWYNLSAEVGQEGTLSAPEAHEKVMAGQITLVDIRRPDEWARTGLPEGALALDMRRDDFAEVLSTHVNGAADSPIALICARGVRSRGLAARLRDAGFARILDVPEGMLGSGAGPGWVRRGLPIVAVDG